MAKKSIKNNQNIQRRGFSLPPTNAKPPMPHVKPPKGDNKGEGK